MKTNRLLFYDILKAYAIILVVLGHVIQTFNPEWKTDNVLIGIYMFHMPLFIAISGFFFVKSADKYTIGTLIKKRFVGIMLPSLTMGVIDVLLIGGGKLFKHKPFDVLYFTDILFTGLWFLTVLFILTVIGIVLYKKLKGLNYYIGWLVVWLFFYIMPDVWVLNQIEFLLPFYVLGIIGRNVKWEKMNVGISVLALIGYCICFSIFTFDDTMYAMGSDCFSLNYIYGTSLRLFSGISGILCSLAFISCLSKLSNRVSKVAAVGAMTLPIYVLHQKFLIINKVMHLHTDNHVLMILIALMLILITIGTYKILHRNKYLALLFFGEAQHK